MQEHLLEDLLGCFQVILGLILAAVDWSGRILVGVAGLTEPRVGLQGRWVAGALGLWGSLQLAAAATAGLMVECYQPHRMPALCAYDWSI